MKHQLRESEQDLNPFFTAAGLIAVALAVFVVLHNAKTVLDTPDPSKPAMPVIEKPLSKSDIFWAVFGALWFFSVTAGILLMILRAVNSL
jgi:hypothetical protein